MINKNECIFYKKMNRINADEEHFIDDIVHLNIGSLRATLEAGLRPLKFSHRYFAHHLIRALCFQVGRWRGVTIGEFQYDLYVEAASEHPHLLKRLREEIVEICRLLIAHGYRSSAVAPYNQLMKMEEYEVAHAVIEARDKTMEMHSSLCASMLVTADEALKEHPKKVKTLKSLMKAILKLCDADTSLVEINDSTAFKFRPPSKRCKELVYNEFAYRERQQFLTFSHQLRIDPKSVSLHPPISNFLAIEHNWKNIAEHITPVEEEQKTPKKRKWFSVDPDVGGTKRRKQKQGRVRASRRR